MKVYTYYEDINFKHQIRLLELWKNSWERNGFDAIILNRKDAENNPFYEHFINSLRILHNEIANKPLDKYGVSCWLRWLAYSSQPEELFYVCDYDVINHNFKPTEPDDVLHLLDGDCPCIASGKPSQFYDLCQNFLNVTEQNKEKFIEYFKEFNFSHYHDQEFFRIYLKLNINKIKLTRRREEFFGIPGEGEFWKKQLVHYGHNLCHKFCELKGVKFDEEARCNIVENYINYENLKKNNEEKYLIECLFDFIPTAGEIYNNDFTLLTDVGKNVTLEGIKGFFPSINTFLKILDVPLCSIENYTEKNKTETSEELKELFVRCGSDKGGPHHNYHLTYGEIFKKFDKNSYLNILEIGIGSKTEKIPSRMSRNFKVGGSLRAYKEYFPNARIFGADVDKLSLFNEDRIKTSYVDQLKPETFEEMHKSFGCPSYDLIIEDGLHSITASLNTLNFALNHTKRGGIIILEDLKQKGNFWNIVSTILKINGYETKLINSNGLILVILL